MQPGCTIEVLPVPPGQLGQFDPLRPSHFLWRRLALPTRIENWSLTSLQQRLVKTGGRLVKHARYYWLLLADGHLNWRRFGAMLGPDRTATARMG